MEINKDSELQLRMLGSFSLSWQGQEINDGDNRSRKVWLLLAYMICCRSHSISQDELFTLLWGDEGTTNPSNALKTMFHRVRTMLDGLGSDAGHTLIVRREGNYAWNTSIPFTLDTDLFEDACSRAAALSDADAQLELYMHALDYYRGDFLLKLSAEPWVVPQQAYYHNLYLQSIRAALPLLWERNRMTDVINLCTRAIQVEPYDESLYQYLMRAHLSQGNQKAVVKIYEDMNDLLFSNFGIMPSDESKSLYRNAMRTVNTLAMDLGLIREQLQEPDSEEGGGAMVCDYDFFRVLYRAECRAVARSGEAIHIAMISVSGGEKELARRSLDCCMNNLQDIVKRSLRKGDVISRCSVSQYILLLPQANYENSCMVCDRIVKTFERQYPHSPAELSYTVQPLVPNT